ncbi:MAG: hypothetical protein FJ398_18525 [Verrucomicrobia bacterium]|nr:hypothetical protein [Verrucomicrobiota bacterium]
MQGTDNNGLPKPGQRHRPAHEAEHRLPLDQSHHGDHAGASEEEARLDHLLRRLPDAPLSSNFTSQVLNLAAREASGRTPSASRALWLSFTETVLSSRWAGRLAIVSVIVAVTALSVHQYQAAARREVARSVAEVSRVASLPMDVLMNYEAIQRLRENPKDRELDLALLAALK